MTTVEWNEIVIQCIQDYKTIKNLEGIEIPPRNFIRAWMQTNYKIFKLSGHFYRMFNFVVNNHILNNENDGLTESFTKKIKGVDNSDILRKSEFIISNAQIRDFLIDNGDLLDDCYNDYGHLLCCVDVAYDKDDLIFINGNEVITEILWSGGQENDLDNIPFVNTGYAKQNQDGDFYITDLLDKSYSLEELQNEYPEQYSKLIDVLKKEMSVKESFTKKTIKKSSKELIKKADSFLFQIGDLYPNTENPQGIVVSNSEKGILIMTITFVDGSGKPTFTKALKVTSLQRAVAQYNKKFGGGWHPLTYEEGREMQLMEHSYNIPWEEQEKIFKCHRDRISKTLKKLGQSSSDIFGTNNLIMQSWKRNDIFLSSFNMGGWEMNDYNSGNMLRLFKRVSPDQISESFTKKISSKNNSELIDQSNSKIGYEIGDAYPSENNIEGIVVAKLDKGILIMTPTQIDQDGQPNESDFATLKNFQFPKAIEIYNKEHNGGWHLLKSKEMSHIGLNLLNPLSKNYQLFLKKSIDRRDKIFNSLKRLGFNPEGFYGMIKTDLYDFGFNTGTWEIKTISGTNHLRADKLRLFKVIGSIDESFTKKIAKKTETDVTKKSDDIINEYEDINFFFKQLSEYFTENEEDFSRKGKPGLYNFHFKDESKIKNYRTRTEGMQSWESKCLRFEFSTVLQKIKKNGQVDDSKQFISRITIFISNNLNYRDKVRFEVIVDKPWNWAKPSMSSSSETFYFLDNGFNSSKNPAHERFILNPSTYGQSLSWKPTNRNAKLFIGMMNMIIDNFSDIKTIVSQYPNTKAAYGYQQAFNEMKDERYNKSPLSVY